MFSFRSKQVWPEISFEEIKKRSRLLVIDDQEFPYRVLFERDGYTIDKWPDVEDLSKLESGYYDIILLDLQGVGREQSSEQGLGILRHLRHTTPAQVIIAYSSADWGLKYQEFFHLADEVLAKSSDYVDFKRRVDQLLQERYSFGFYLNRVDTLLRQHVENMERVTKLVRLSVARQSPKKLQQYLERSGVDPQIISAALSVVQTAIMVASIWMKH